MLKFLFGILVMIALVGYGVIDTGQVQSWGDTVVSWINGGANFIKEATEPSLTDQALEKLRE
jgi:hypothetical protein